MNKTSVCRPWARRRLVLLLACCAGVLLNGAAWGSHLIRFGSAWRYLDDGSNPETAWRELNFEDDGWVPGLAQLGYGDGDEATEVSFGPYFNAKFITTYFRHKFVVVDTRAFTNLMVRLIRDDAAIVYLNGVEIFRSNLPSGPVNYLTRALTSVSGAGETAVLINAVNPALLTNGDNILAVEIHQDDPASSDISFDLELTDGKDDAPRVTITSPAHYSSFPAPDHIAISVSATDPNGTVTNVQFFAGNQLLGEKNSQPYTLIWSNVVSGAHILTARARDDSGLVTISSAVRFLVGSGGKSNLTLVPAGAVWKCLDNGSNQGTAWRQPVFDDSGWREGLAEFGYGDGDEATIVGYGGVSTARYVTTYFRRKFVVADPAGLSALVLRLLQDDGAVVYLNGNEVFRNNLPPGAITSTTLALSALSAPAEETFTRTNLSLAAVIEGTNTLAVEVHQSSANSSDLSFNLELLGSELPGLVRGPWLQTPTTTNITIRWRTDVSVAGRVLFGLSPASLTTLAVEPISTTEHRIELRNLLPATRYYYTIGALGGPLGGPLLAGSDYHFTTLPISGTRQKTRFWALGDCGTGNANQFDVRDAFYRANGTNELDFLLLLGDNAYNSGIDSEYQHGIFDVYPTVLRNTPVWSTLGNHETDQSTSPSPNIAYYSIFTLPRDGEAGGFASGTESYYSFDFANIHFVCLDSMTSSRSSIGPMATWLRADLENTTQEWVIAFWHHPPYTKGSHDSDEEGQLIEVRQNLLPILEANGVDLVLCGHSHSYERSHLLSGHYGHSSTLNAAMKLDARGGRVDDAGAYVKPSQLSAHRGTVYVVAGSSGKISGGSLNHPAMFLSLNRLGSLLAEVDGDRLDLQFIRENGTTNDHFTIIKGPAVMVTDVTVTEPDTNGMAAVFTVHLTETNEVPVTVSFAAFDESAHLGDDFHVSAGALTFPPGVTTQWVFVPIVGDLLPELEETFLLGLHGSPLVARSMARGTIVDNDSVIESPTFSNFVHDGTTMSLSWPTIAGRHYHIVYKDELAASEWKAFPQVIIGDGAPATFTDDTTGVPQRFYRIRVD